MHFFAVTTLYTYIPSISEDNTNLDKDPAWKHIADEYFILEKVGRDIDISMVENLIDNWETGVHIPVTAATKISILNLQCYPLPALYSFAIYQEK